MGNWATRVKDWAAELFVRAEQRGRFRKLPAFERDLADYPELLLLEQHYPAIREECEALIDGRIRIPGMEELSSYTAGGIHQVAWKSFMFKSGRFIEENCRLAPNTAALLRALPGVYTAFFSVLEPHQHIKAHWGYWKGFVRYHLGVVIPGNNRDGACWIRINTEAQERGGDRAAIEQGTKYYWRNGEAVLFDDTFLHDACNDSDEVRVVLFLDVARKMPFPLSLLNRLFLWIAHMDASVRAIRANAAVKAA
ncbi:MAG TPA: aspartyl/asparaginyl beta-hydroxylase domain-containing protein [Rhizomicrobium sp.]|nr:aspartyl/asparaginyl beta-hydroxylase domain-containing protein [Rhizomicrobium sp.]